MYPVLTQPSLNLSGSMYPVLTQPLNILFSSVYPVLAQPLTNLSGSMYPVSTQLWSILHSSASLLPAYLLSCSSSLRCVKVHDISAPFSSAPAVAKSPWSVIRAGSTFPLKIGVFYLFHAAELNDSKQIHRKRRSHYQTLNIYEGQLDL